MDGSFEQNLKTLTALDSAELGRLVRAKALQAVAMHFACRGMYEQLAVNGEPLWRGPERLTSRNVWSGRAD